MLLDFNILISLDRKVSYEEETKLRKLLIQAFYDVVEENEDEILGQLEDLEIVEISIT